MSHFSDSRDPSGIGYLILQDHGYTADNIPDANRGSLVGVRVTGRFDKENELGEWEEDRFARGPIGGGAFWPRQTTNAGGWQFAWPAVTCAPGRPSNVTPYPGTGSANSDASMFLGSSGGGGDWPWGYYETGLLAGKKRYPTLSDGSPDWEMIWYLFQSGQLELDAYAESYLKGLKSSGVVDRSAQANALSIQVGVNPRLVGGVFGLGVTAYSVGIPTTGSYIFGIGGPALYARFVLVPDPTGNPLDANKKGNAQAQAQKNAAGQAQENASKAYFVDVQTEEDIPLEFAPVNHMRLPDRRYHTIRDSLRPVGWPTIPKGVFGAMMASTTEDRQTEQWLHTDPRLVAPHFSGPSTVGTPVADMGGPEHSLSLERHAPLQSLVRVIRGPTGKRGMLGQNAKAETQRNWLAWNIGPTGQWDTCGGLVVDVPTSYGTMARNSRILAMASVNYGGPFDVGHYGDEHRIGSDLDGNPINSLHISTDAFFKLRTDVLKDGALFFESYYPDYAIDLDVPLRVHLGWDQTAKLWKWWTTTFMYTPFGERTPRDPKEPPGGPITPTPGTGGGSTEGGGEGEGEGGSSGGQGRRWDPKQGRWIDDLPNASAPIINVNLEAGKSGDKLYQMGAAMLRELTLPGFSLRPQLMTAGEVDARFAGTDAQTRRRIDSTTPIVARIESFGAQGGPAGGPYIGGGGDWDYTQSPLGSRSPGGTSNGGFVLLPPEVDMSDVDEDFAPAGLDLSESVFIFGPGTRSGVGYPELATGGLKSGFSFSLENTDEMHFTQHNAAATLASDPTLRLYDDGVEVWPGFYVRGQIRVTPFSAGDAPFILTSDATGNVQYLDADKVDGKDGSYFVPRAYGGIRVVDGSGSQSLSTTPTKITQFNDAVPSSGMTSSHAADQITIGSDGTYKVDFSISFNGKAATTYRFHVRVGGVEWAGGAHEYIANAAQVGGAGFHAVIDGLVTNDILTIYGESDDAGGKNCDIEECQFIVTKLDDL